MLARRAALASFTLFSGTLDDGKVRIEARVRSLSDHYAAYVGELQRTATQSASAHTISRMQVNLPPRWKAVTAREPKIWTRTQDVDRIIRSLEQDHDVKTDFREKQHPEPTPPTDAIEDASDNRGTPPDGHEAAPSGAAEFTEGKIESLRSNLRERRSKIWRTTAEFLQTQMGGKVPESLVSDLLSHKHIAALHAVGQDYPLLDALLGVLEKAISAEFAERIKQTVFRLSCDATVTDPGTQLVLATESSGPIDWSPASEALARADRQSRTELVLLDAALKQCEVIEARVIAAETAAFASRKAALKTMWEGIARLAPAQEATDAVPTTLSEPLDEPRSPDLSVSKRSVFDRYRAMTDLINSDPVSDLLNSFHAPGVTSQQIALAMSEAEAIVAASGSAQDKAERLRKLVFKPSWRRPDDATGLLLPGLFRSTSDDLGLRWENDNEREQRALAKKADFDRGVAEESAKIRQREHAEFKAQHGYEMEEVEGLRAVRGIRIGKWELPRIPWRLLREVRIP
jgi:hypothetical protein